MRRPVLVVSLALLAMGLAVPLVLGMPQAGGLGTFFVFTLWCNGPWSPLLPALYEPVLLAAGRTHGGLPVAVVGTIGTLLVEWANYRVHSAAISSDKLTALREHRATGWLANRFAARPFFYVWLAAWSPIPYWPVRTLSPLAGLPVARHLLATAIGRFPRLWFIAAAGALFQPPLWSLVVITMAPVVIAGVVWYKRKRAGEPLSVEESVAMDVIEERAAGGTAAGGSAAGGSAAGAPPREVTPVGGSSAIRF